MAETAEIQKTEGRTPEIAALRNLQPNGQLDMKKEFADFARRVVTRSNEGTSKQEPHTELEKDTPALDQWKKTGEVKPKPAKEPAEAKSDPETKPDAKADAKSVAKPDAKASEGAEDEPKPDERMWGNITEQPTPKDLEGFKQRLVRLDGSVREHVNQHEQSFHVQAGLNGMFAGRADQYADFVKALTEVKNPGEVLSHLGLNKSDRQILLQQPNWKLLRAAVHHISKGIAAKAKAEGKAEAATPEPKPRAPKPPVEVGGRGTGGGDPSLEAARNGDFAAFEASENAKRFKR
jgi:hypothetical protein